MFYSISLLLYMVHSSFSLDYARVCYDNEGSWSGPVCLDDSSGFYKVLCEIRNPSTQMPFTKCSGGKCACDGYPKVPQYGLLTYTGSQYGNYDSGELGIPGKKFREAWNGTTAKDENGRYYKEFKDVWMHTRPRKQEFELILPKDGSFVKYSGWLGNRNCKEIFPWNHAAGPLFDTYHWHTNYKKIGEVQQGNNRIQTWYHEHQDWYIAEEFNEATYTYIYNATMKISIPLKYSHLHQYYNDDRTDEKNFVYKDVIEDESIFDVGKYCTEFTKFH